MHYNLLNFGVFSSYCTIDKNNPSEKTAWSKTVMDHYLPDVLLVNEMSPSGYYQDLFLDEVMNASGRDNYSRAATTNQAGSEIVNMMYYDHNKFGLADQDVISFWLRDMNIYKLYYRTSALAQRVDTTFVYFVSAHFKAGTSGSDKETRAQMANAIIEYLTVNKITEACLICGDLNLQNNLEPAWDGLTTEPAAEYRFSDPAMMEGIWHNNQDFAAVHTQSTQTAFDGCKASGGMDDRFDFILVNDALLSDENKVRYVQDSYEIPGQDGQRLNGSLIDPPNFSASPEVIDAMFNLSDHLPVIVDLEIEDDGPLPETWNFETTSVFHALYLPLEVLPTLNSSLLPEGSFIGMFYTNNGTAICAGHKQWFSGQDTELICYGNDNSVPGKNGFYEGEPIIFKVFDIQQQAEFYADADLNINYPNADGRFQSNGVSVISGLDAAYLQIHAIELDAGWNSLSSFIEPKMKTIESVFGDDFSKVGFMQGDELIFYPAGGIDDLKYWTGNTSFILKTDESFTLNVEGLPIDETIFQLSAGWNMISVPVPCYVDPNDLETVPPGNIIAIKELISTSVFWPGKGVHNLSLLIPGNAYLINVADGCTLEFESCK
jgi:endonuclease/exonuclease/phosphatase family metal-dependent hydrolase